MIRPIAHVSSEDMLPEDQGWTLRPAGWYADTWSPRLSRFWSGPGSCGDERPGDLTSW